MCLLFVRRTFSAPNTPCLPFSSRTNNIQWCWEAKTRANCVYEAGLVCLLTSSFHLSDIENFVITALGSLKVEQYAFYCCYHRGAVNIQINNFCTTECCEQQTQVFNSCPSSCSQRTPDVFWVQKWFFWMLKFWYYW